ncbi:pectinesterase inhibitor 28-like [Phragmites australis]|uniref:pectinesterase inhibitor 28-like n=1 Tax=Phragmites australis TaxID=29695 RepID=UPI002D791B7F|nr:pectinesterase inhibitor 28-like [Phragmites australis]
MASLQALSSCVLLLLVLDACMASSMLQDKCESFAAGDRSSYDYCVRTLQRDRASATADERGLAAIAARIARATAKATGSKIAARQGYETVPARRDCLAACALEYAAAVRRLGRAARDAARGRDLQRVQTLLAEVTGAPARCDGAFKAAGQFSPLAGADLGLDDEVELAIALLSTPPSPTRA